MNKRLSEEAAKAIWSGMPQGERESLVIRFKINIQVYSGLSWYKKTTRNKIITALSSLNDFEKLKYILTYLKK